MRILKPSLREVNLIKNFVDEFARKGDILPRSLHDIAERVREFVIVKENNKLIGVSGLRLYYPDLAEIRTIVVDTEYQGKGIGKLLVEFELEEARTLGVKKVFALTFKKEFFVRLGFSIIDKKELPSNKIWEDCIKCPFFPDCKEEAVIKNID